MRTALKDADSIAEQAKARRDAGHTVFVANYQDKLTSGFHEKASDWIEAVESEGWTLDSMTRHAYVTTVIFRLSKLGVDILARS